MTDYQARVLEYDKLMKYYIMRMLTIFPKAGEADDLKQECYVKMFGAEKTFDSERDMKNYVYKVMHRVICDNDYKNKQVEYVEQNRKVCRAIPFGGDFGAIDGAVRRYCQKGVNGAWGVLKQVRGDVNAVSEVLGVSKQRVRDIRGKIEKVLEKKHFLVAK